MTDLESKKMISGDMLVGQIVNEYPQAVEILMEVGMHCLGCPSCKKRFTSIGRYNRHDEHPRLASGMHT
ncbi:DUF1858 domain-containing protein [Treponema berlinense]|uniref:DUF1858 domain-containing protein n=1 Tax=Treponema berlinense TaxID=225004 RepID=UPI003C6EDA48